MSDRLQIAEKMYAALREKPAEEDAGFWADFYRVKGYHLARERKPDLAKEARTRALTLTQILLREKDQEGHRKELLIASASMRYFTGDSEGALLDLEEAGKLNYTDEKLEAEQQKGYDEYLTKLIADLLKGVKGKSVPPDLGAEDGHN